MLNFMSCTPGEHHHGRHHSSNPEALYHIPRQLAEGVPDPLQPEKIQAVFLQDLPSVFRNLLTPPLPLGLNVLYHLRPASNLRGQPLCHSYSTL